MQHPCRMATLKAQQRHVCLECDRHFTKAEHLRRHKRVHTKERPFRCPECDMSYARLDTLQRHSRSHRASVQRPCRRREGAQDATDVSESPLCSPGGEGERPRCPAFPVSPPSSTVPHWTGETNLFELPDTAYTDTLDWEWLASLVDPLVDNNQGHFESDVLAKRPDANISAPRGTALAGTPVRWFADIPSSAASESSRALPLSSASPTTVIDDAYRDVVQKQIEPVTSQDAVPSTQSLGHCVRLYWDKCSDILPIIHLPTFRASESNAFLLFSIASIGTQLVGLPEMARRGEKMFESLHRAVLMSWTSILSGSHEAVPVMQAVLLGQTFAMMSSNPVHLLTAQAFHGTLVLCCARFRRHLEDTHARQQYHSESTSSLEERWQLWATDQSFTRIEHSLKILDAEFSLLYHSRPLVRSQISLISENENVAFSARNAKHWQMLESSQTPAAWVGDLSSDEYSNPSMVPSQNGPAIGIFSQYARLAEILARVAEVRILASGTPAMTGPEADLEAWLRQNSEDLRLSKNATLQLECLWHSGWLSVLCDIDLLEVACGRDGAHKGDQARPRVEAWASDVRARCAIIHAFKILQLISRIPFSTVVALHVPRAAYHAGLVLVCIAAAGHESVFPIEYAWGQLTAHRGIESLQDTQRLTATDKKELEQNFTTSTRLREQSCMLVSLLRRLWPWGISGRFASTLGDLLQV